MSWHVKGLLAVTVLLMSTSAHALPRMSLTAGSPCATCHVTAQGGGARNEIGWSTQLFTRMVGFEKVGMASWDEAETNTMMDGKLAIGIDLRSQIARLGKPKAKTDGTSTPGFNKGFVEADKPDLIMIPMQFQPYVSVMPTSWLTVTGSYNISTVEIGPKKSVMYPGQSAWDAQLVLHGDPKLPQLRLGYLQPTIGIRHDDHTMLIRADALAPRRPAIPAGYAEAGGELNYQPKSWLRVDAGAYLNNNLHTAMSGRPVNPLGTKEGGGLAWLGRVSLMPQLLDLGLNTWIGASAFGSEAFMMFNGFVGVGKNEIGSLQLEASMSQGDGSYETLNLMALASYNLKEWFIIEARLEQATASAKTEIGQRDAVTRQAVFGVQFFPLPYIELRPEYRYILASDDEAGLKNEYALGQYTLQIHMFF
ncbi:MAG: hypothetical protein KC502_16180 [Myxococcales bacterium]|nr:hypothetical protein [Myxococcales bacterium]